MFITTSDINGFIHHYISFSFLLFLSISIAGHVNQDQNGGLKNMKKVSFPLNLKSTENIEINRRIKNVSKIVDFVFETSSRIRVRPAIQNMTTQHIEKYKEAIRRMKALDSNDPRSFAQQALIHGAYCDKYSPVSIYILLTSN